MTRNRIVGVAVLAVLLSFTPSVPLDAADCTRSCYSYPNTTRTWYPGYGDVCAGYGYGCYECVSDLNCPTQEPGDCVRNEGSTVCNENVVREARNKTW